MTPRNSGGSRYNVVGLDLRYFYFYLKLEFCVYNRPGYLSYSINLAYYVLNIRDLSGIIMGGMQRCSVLVLAMGILLIMTHEKVSIQLFSSISVGSPSYS